MSGQALPFIILALSIQPLTALARYVGEQVSWTATNDMRADVTALSNLVLRPVAASR